MIRFLLPISLFACLSAPGQNYKDTTYTVRGFQCTCKYNFSISDDNKLFGRTLLPAIYPGGEEEWKKFMKKNIDSKFRGKQELLFRFEVDKNGDPNSFLLLNNAPKEEFDEVVRVILLSGKWFPAVQGGFCVKSFVRMKFDL